MKNAAKALVAAKAGKKVFMIGHSAYGEWCGNHLHSEYCLSKSSAINVLRDRGAKRNDARYAVNEAAKGGHSGAIAEIVCISYERLWNWHGKLEHGHGS